MSEREMLEVTKCIGVSSLVAVLMNIVCEQKITSGSKKNCVKFLRWSDIPLERY